MSATSTLALDGAASSAAAFTAMVSVARITITRHRCGRTTAPTDWRIDPEAAYARLPLPGWESLQPIGKQPRSTVLPDTTGLFLEFEFNLLNLNLMAPPWVAPIL
jgi:hypothetical protein